MTSKPKQKPTASPRLGTRARRELREAYATRGHLKSKLWLHYSSKMKMDVVLASEIQYKHFLFVESDPAVEYVDYAPKGKVVAFAGDMYADIVHAEIRLKPSEKFVWREVVENKNSSKDVVRSNLKLLLTERNDKQVHHEIITGAELARYQIQIRNWHRILPWLAGTRDVELHHHTLIVLTMIRKQQRICFRDLESLDEGGRLAYLQAALFQLVQQGHIGSDLDVREFTRDSRFFLKEFHD
jgi:hypothetical protein